MGKKDRSKKKGHQAPAKGKKGKSHATSAAASSASCRHRNQASVSSRPLASGCAVSGCESEVQNGCLACGLMACKPHAKRHWVKNPQHHSLSFEVGDGRVFCWECQLHYSDPLDDDVAAAVASLSSPQKEEQEEAEKGKLGGSASSSSSLSQTKPGNGLVNLGNTCFMNSVLQCVAYLPPVRAALQDGSVSSHVGPLGKGLLSALAGVWSPASKGRFSPVELQKVVRSAFSQFRRGTQEDAHEFFRTVVDGVDEEHKKKDSFVRELFHLNTTSVVTCHGCQTSFARLEDAFDCSLQLEAPAKKKSNNNNNKKNKNKKKKDVVGEEQEQEHEEAEPVELVTTLWPSFGGKKFPIFVAASFPVFAEERQDCLSAAAVVPVVVARVDVVAGRYDARRQDAEEQKAACPFLRAFSEPEVLSGRDKYFCGKCQRRHDASKQLLLGPKLPRVLVLHFKRFAVSLEGELRKIESPIAGLSERLDVRPFCAAANNNSIKNNDITDNNKALYSLCGVVEHMGSSLRSGHYVAHVRLGEKWWLVSDTSVRPSSLAQALSSQAYLAFFS